jgi:hypothetical protein
MTEAEVKVRYQLGYRTAKVSKLALAEMETSFQASAAGRAYSG